ncbi:GFA family protein [Hirschia maritima]|uniref:GFA family protein n=1 Tax=Hirschia maritima TaxID=1121961 RepID=UPI000381262F|nr:GFA family protein [Hirschia maritima]
MITGKCNCGTVSFRANAKVQDIYMCHCSICQKFTGSGGIPVIIVPKDKFSWLSGEDNVKIWKKPNADWESNFCNTCGSPAPGKNDDSTMFIPVGVITQGSETLKMAHHIFVGSKPKWTNICDEGKQHPEEFGSGN